jgi:hypothetical protein
MKMIKLKNKMLKTMIPSLLKHKIGEFTILMSLEGHIVQKIRMEIPLRLSILLNKLLMRSLHLILILNNLDTNNIRIWLIN